MWLAQLQSRHHSAWIVWVWLQQRCVVTFLRVFDTIAVICITFCYSFLLHSLHLWANAAERRAKRSEKVRVYLSYVPTLFLPFAIYKIWTHQYAPMLQRVHLFVIPMAVWIAYVLAFIAVTELLIAKTQPQP